jgi:hypothetical protein
LKKETHPPPKPKTKDAAPRAAWFDPRAPYLVPLLLAVLVRAWQWALIPFAAEDAYITFRFAEHWAHGLGPVYNAGERVMGFSSPLWTAWLALGTLVTGSAFPVARFSGVVLDLATLVLGARLLEKEHGRMTAWVFAAMLAVHPIFSANSVLGMETSLFLFLLVASAWAIGAGHRSAGPLIGLLALVRPEGVVAAAIAAIAARPKDRLVALSIFAVGVLGLTLYFGNPIPQSVIAKAATYGIAGPLSGIQWIEGFTPWLIQGRWPVTPEGNSLLPIALVGTPAALVGAWLLWRKRGRPGAAWIVGAAGMVLLFGYFVAGAPYFYWYGVVPTAGWVWLAAIGMPEISRHRLLFASLAVFVISDTWMLRNLYAGRVQEEVRNFRVIGLTLRDMAGGRGSVMLEPIGHVGDVAKSMRIIDEVGLVAPRVSQRRRQGAGWYADMVAQERPDWLIVRRGFFERNESFAGVSSPFRSDADRAAVLAAYDAVPLPDAALMRIYRRKP